jgi:nitrous oxide reductase
MGSPKWEGEQMSEKKEAGTMGRRDFFRKAGLGAGAAGAVAATLSRTPAKAAVAGGKATDGKGYQETDHVKKYYELARF